MADKTYTAAVIGVGPPGEVPFRKGGGHKIGYVHGQMHKQHPQVKLQYACDIVPANLEGFQRHFDVPHGFADYREMLAKTKPDIVSICTYVGLHRPMIEAAARAGVKAIFCEKPFVASPADLDVVRKVLAETGVKLVIAHIRRYRPAMERAMQLFTSGAMGKPVLTFGGVGGWDISEMGSHWLDLIRYFHGDRDVKWVMGQFRVTNQQGYGHTMEDHGVAYFEFDGGGKGLFDGGSGMADGTFLTLTGTEGTIRIFSENKLVITTPKGHESTELTDPLSNEWSTIWSAALADLVRWVEGGPEPRIGFSTSGKTAELNLAAYVSAVRGDRVDLPLSDPLNEWPVEILARRAEDGRR
jgi:UDP-N-acetylglucosamine 3-dehydrogenase